MRSFDCDDYFLYTPGPGEGGRYSIQVSAPRSRRGALPYHLQVARAGEDDTAPGASSPTTTACAASLRGSGADVVDLYRFDVRRPSILDLRLRAGSSARSTCSSSARAGAGSRARAATPGSQQIRLRLKPGRYFTAVRSRSGAERPLHALAPDAR